MRAAGLRDLLGHLDRRCKAAKLRGPPGPAVQRKHCTADRRDSEIDGVMTETSPAGIKKSESGAKFRDKNSLVYISSTSPV